MDELDQHDVERDLVDSAETIADMWTNFSVSIANKLRDMQGLALIEFPRHGDGEQN